MRKVMSVENVPTPTRVLSDDPVLIAWRRDTSAVNSCWAANWGESTDVLSSRAKSRSFLWRQVGAKVVGAVDGTLVGSEVAGALVGLRVGLCVGLATGPVVASQHVRGAAYRHLVRGAGIGTPAPAAKDLARRVWVVITGARGCRSRRGRDGRGCWARRGRRHGRHRGGGCSPRMSRHQRCATERRSGDCRAC